MSGIGRLALCLTLFAAPAAACNLALVLALDVSSSVDAEEDLIQRQGLSRALLAPDVQRAFLDSAPVALYAFEWSGQETQVALTPGWVMVNGPDDLALAASAIATSVRSRDDLPTALGRALGHAAILLRDGPDCARSAIDVSGDGENNESYGPQLAYANFPFDGITVNALIIAGRNDDLELISYFRQQVLHGPGAFSLGIRGFDDYQPAMEAKLLRELRLPALSSLQ